MRCCSIYCSKQAFYILIYIFSLLYRLTLFFVNGYRMVTLRRERHPTLVFLPGEFHGQRSLAGYSPWGRKESDMTEQLNWTELNWSKNQHRFQIYVRKTEKITIKSLFLVSVAMKGKVLVTQLCLILCDCKDCSPPGSSVLGDSPARILEWIAISFPRGFSHSGIEPMSPELQEDFFFFYHLGHQESLIWGLCSCKWTHG